MPDCNLKYVDIAIKERKKRDSVYRKLLENVNGIRLFIENPYIKKNYGFFPILVEDTYNLSRDKLYDLLKKNNYYTRKYFYPLTCDQVCFKNKYNTHDLSNAKKLASTVLILPLYENLQLNRLREITEIIKCSLDAL